MPTPESANPFLEIMNATSKVDPGALMTVWANLPSNRSGFTGDLFERFDDIDRDRDGLISRRELDRACASYRFKGQQAAALATLRCFFEEVEKLCDDDIGAEDDGVTRADLAGLDLAALSGLEHEVLSRTQRRYAYAKRKIARAPRTVFEHAADGYRLLPDGGVCKQGLMGDCFFLAPLVAMALNNRLVSMIREHPEIPGSWLVHFHGASEAITVGPPTDSEIALFSTADGSWPVIFEKAYGLHQANNGQDHPIRPAFPPMLAKMDGNETGRAIEVLTGNDVDHDELASTPMAMTRAKLHRALRRSKIVVASTPPGKKKKNEIEWTDDGLVRGHAYSVVNFSIEREVVVVRNPWGDEDGGLRGAEVSDGFFEMPLDAFHGNFTDVYYEL